MMISQRASALVAVVEDDPACRIALGRLLRAEGFDVALFESAEAYLGAAVPAPPVCVIVDVQLPGMSGLDLQRRLHDEGNGTPVILMTGASEMSVQTRAERIGCAKFFWKPVDSDALLETLASITRHC